MKQIKSQVPKPNDYIHRRANARLQACLGIIYKSMLDMLPNDKIGPRVSADSEMMQEHADAHGSSVFTDACHCFPEYGDDDKAGDHHPIRHALIAMIVAYNEHNGLRDITGEDIVAWKQKYYARARSMAFTDISGNLMDSLKALVDQYDPRLMKMQERCDSITPSSLREAFELVSDLKQIVEEYQ